MGAHYVCDYCGESIDDEYRHASLMVLGGWDREYGPRWWQRHFHAENGRPCWKLVGELIDAASDPTEAGTRPRTEREEREQMLAEWREQQARWTALSYPQREHLLIELLGEKRLAVAQLAEKVQEKLGPHSVHYPEVYVVLKRMHLAGEVARESETFRGTRTRHRYFRKDMSGPIVDLERTFHEQDEEA